MNERQHERGERVARGAEDGVTLTLLVDNYVERPGLLGEHGLSWLVQAGDQQLLFDTGQGTALEHNAERLGIKLDAVDAILLSHGHYDHTGGLIRVLEKSPRAPVFAHPAALEPKYARKSVDQFAAIGIPATAPQLASVVERLRPTLAPAELLPGVWATGPIPRCLGSQGTERHFFLDPEGRRSDPLLDDQALFFDTRQGLVIVLGCAHAGVLCTLRYVLSVRPGSRIAAILGGMHMKQACARQRRSIVEALVQLGIGRIVPAHCSGRQFAVDLLAVYGERCELSSVGHSWCFERADG